MPRHLITAAAQMGPISRAETRADTVRRLCLDGSNQQPKFILPSPLATIKTLGSPSYAWLSNLAVTAAEILGGFCLGAALVWRAFGGTLQDFRDLFK